MRPRAAVLAGALALVPACYHQTRPIPAVPGTFVTAIAGGEWSMLELHGRPIPGGAGGKRPTIRFGSTSARATGFAGCNTYTAGFEVTHDTLRFQPPEMRRLACTVGTDLERDFLAVLRQTERYRVADGDLLLLRGDDILARFTRGGN